MENEGPDSILASKRKEISLNTLLHKAYKEILIIDIVGFILAASAAVASAAVIVAII